MKLDLTVLPGRWAVCRLAPDAAIPEWAEGGTFASITRTAAELSILCPENAVPADVRHQGGWRLIRFAGTFAFDQTGVLASVTGPLAAAEVGILAVATFDTDYLFVSQENLPRALDTLREAGHRVEGEGI
ncbi:MAG: ACT domain-containing protein [Acidobacteriota bacterium]